MAQKKLYEEFDAFSNTHAEYFYDDVEQKMYVRAKADLVSLEKYAHDKRMVEKGVGSRFKEDGYHSMGVLPGWIFWQHPEFEEDDVALRRFLEYEVPKLKTTNAKLI